MVGSSDSNRLVKGVLLGGLIGAGLIALTRGRQGKTSRSQDSGNNGSVVVGSLIGAVLGVAAGLLLAPESGDELRKDLGDKYDEIREKAEQFLNELNKKGHAATAHLDDWKDSLVSLVDNFSSENVRKEASTKLDEVVEWANLAIKLWHKFTNRR